MGLRVAIDRKVVSRAMREAISTGLYEATETRLLPCLIRPGNSVLEVCPGVGFVAAFVMLRCRPRAYCAIEADARLIHLIHRTLNRNGVSAGVGLERNGFGKGMAAFPDSRGFLEFAYDRKRYKQFASIKAQSLSHAISTSGENARLGVGITMRSDPQRIGNKAPVELIDRSAAHGPR
jgi:hypothetical protein